MLFTLTFFISSFKFSLGTIHISIFKTSAFFRGALCDEMEFYGDISRESKCNIEINVWAHSHKILLVYLPRVKMMPEKTKTTKIGKGSLKLSFFLWFAHWWNHLCGTDWLGVVKDIKEILKFYKNELRLYFTVTSWFLGNVEFEKSSLMN